MLEVLYENTINPNHSCTVRKFQDGPHSLKEETREINRPSHLIDPTIEGNDILVIDISIPLIEGEKLREKYQIQLEGFGDDLDVSPSQWCKICFC